MYKLLTSAKDNDELFIGFHRNRNRRRDELANNTNIKGKYYVRIMLKDVFGFCETSRESYFWPRLKKNINKN